MRVRLLGSEDQSILDAAVRTFRGVEVDDHTAFLGDPATIAFAATDGDDVIGWAWGMRQRHAGGYSQVQLYEIEVVHDRRRRGTGRALLSAFLDLATREGHRRLWLFTDQHNVAAQALYREAGGEPSPHEDAAFWWQLDAQVRDG